MATLITKNSSTASSVPTAGSLTKGELAVNVTDKKLYTKDNSSNVVKLVGSLGNQEANAVAITGGNVSGVAQTSSTINSTVIGNSSPQAITGTTVTASTGFVGNVTGNVTGNLTGNVTGDVTGNLTGNVTGNVTASSGTTTLNNLTINGTLDMNSGSAGTVTGLSTPVNATDAATKGYVDTSISNLIDTAPATLDTLNELAAALGDDPNFATTVTNEIATKLPLAGGTMTGAIAMSTYKITNLGTPSASTDAATKGYVDTADALKLSLTGGTMSGAIAMGTNKITGLGTPTANEDATTKAYVDGILGSATSAAASAAAAAVSETNAANSASSALTSANNAAASYDSFDDRYLGPKASDPTVDNDGNALLTGALYWNTVSNEMRVWSGSSWVSTYLPAPGTSGNVLTSTGTTWTSAAPAATLLGDTDSASPYETSLGYQAGNANTGEFGTFIGYNAGRLNSTGRFNSVLGYSALENNQTGEGNVAIGYQAGVNTTAGENTYVGYNAGRLVSSGTNNTYVGQGAGANLNASVGIRNVSVGDASLRAITSGNFNTAIGATALTAVTTSSNNTAVGYQAGDGITTGAQNVLIGTGAGSSGTNDLTTGSNNIIIGYNAEASSASITNEITIGTSNHSRFRAFGDLQLQRDYTEKMVTTNTGTAYTIDLANGTVFLLTLTGNCTFTFPTATAGKSFMLFLKQDATGSRTVTWPSAVLWPGGTAPTITSTASKRDKFVFTSDGTNWYGSVAGQAYTV